MEALINSPFVMDEENKSVLDTSFKLKDVAQLIGILVTGVWFIVSMNSKIDALTSAVNDLKDNSTKQSVTNDLAIKAIQNQVSTNTIQISLLQKDIDVLKSKK